MDSNHIVIVVDDAKVFGMRRWQGFGNGFGQRRNHEAQDGRTLFDAGGIEVTMNTLDANRGGAVPEFGNLQRQ